MKSKMEKSTSFEMKDDFSSFLDKLHNWKISSREIIREITQDLEEKAGEEERVFDLVESLKLENATLTNTVRDLQETINSLNVIEEENRNIKLEVRNLRLKNENLVQFHKTEMEETTKNLNEMIEQGERERREIVENLNKELENQTKMFETKLSAITNENNQLFNIQEEMKQQRRNDIQMLELEMQTEINYLKEKLDNAEQKALKNNRSSMNQDIFRRKLHNLQVEYSNKIQTLTKEIDILKKELASIINSREPNEVIIPESRSGKTFCENDVKKETVKSNKKRKLYRPESTNALLNSPQS